MFPHKQDCGKDLGKVANPYYYSSESGCNQLPGSALVVLLELLDLSVLARRYMWWCMPEGIRGGVRQKDTPGTDMVFK